jgi:signal peptidase I
MPAGQDNTQDERTALVRLHHSLTLLIALDLLTFGLYSTARSYLLHNELSQKIGRQLFSLAFLHILVLLNLMLGVLRFSRDDQPLDASLPMARLGTSLLFISLLLIFRRCLREQFQLHIRPWPLAFFGFWYLQYRINRSQRPEIPAPLWEPWPIPVLIVLMFVSLSLGMGAVKHHHVSSASMEPTLTVGDFVLVDLLSPVLPVPPQRGEILVFRSNQDDNTVQIKRVLGLPGDRIAFHEDRIVLNGEVLNCAETGPGNRRQEFMDQSAKRSFQCQLAGRTFVVDRYQQGALTWVQGEFLVPSDHYFLVGDNLDNSPDSRVIGAIPASHILGLARMTTISYRPGESVPWHRWFQPL